jgi:predicted regulator of Ras-like GTPase activity (Roadblock/LC7/MglB family)
MSFESILESIVDQGKGVLAVALVETDGITIAQALSKDAAQQDAALDLSAAGIEFGRIIGDVAKAADALGGGRVAETIVVMDRMTLVFERVEEDILLIAALSRDGNLGKARYLIRRNLLPIRQEL